MCSRVGVVGLMQVTFPHSAARSRRMTLPGHVEGTEQGLAPTAPEGGGVFP